MKRKEGINDIDTLSMPVIELPLLPDITSLVDMREIQALLPIDAKEDEPVPIEQEAIASLTEAQSNMKKQIDAQRNKFVRAVDSEYWIAICFQSRQQKEQFLRNAGIDHLGDKYLSGAQVARKLKVKLDKVEKIKEPKKPNKKLVGLT